jgi:predicted TIM-barrel fold metal-dependent hydrolase
MGSVSLERYEKLHIIDTDSHWSEPFDLWTKRAPKKFADRVPQVRQNENGRNDWWIDDRLAFPYAGTSFVNNVGDKTRAASMNLETGIPWSEIHPASYDGKARVELLDQLGIYAQVVYPNVLGFAAQALIQMLDQELAYTIVQIYNDAGAEMQEESGDRVFPMALLPFWNIDDCVKEAQRIKDIGLRGVLMAGNPHLGGLPDLGQPVWEPLYDALSDLRLPINIHVGAVNHDASADYEATWPSHATDKRVLSSITPVVMELFNARFISNLVLSEIPLRWPNLKWVSVESGVGWIPYVLERIDYTYREQFPGEEPPKFPPALEMFRKAIYGCFWFEETATQLLIDRLGADNVMWETDFPHPTCLFPSPVERAAETMVNLSDETVRKVMQDNASKLYNIELPQPA